MSMGWFSAVFSKERGSIFESMRMCKSDLPYQL